jgi:tripartite-type tricarboxylate transporter receptor subunit TctC
MGCMAADACSPARTNAIPYRNERDAARLHKRQTQWEKQMEPSQNLLCSIKAACVAVTLISPLAVSTHVAAEYPERPVSMIVCFAAGGVTDIAARLLSTPLAEALGKPVVVENKGGAGGNIGISAAMRAPADGYSLLFCTSAYVVNPSLYTQVAYDPYKDFIPLVTIAASPNVVVVSGTSNIMTLPDYIARAKAAPDKTNWTSPGIGSTPYLAGEVLKLRAGIKGQHIPFPGTGPAGQALLSGDVDMMTASLGSVMGQITAGAYRPLAQTGSVRWPGLPDVPTLGELGIKDAESDTFQAVFAPAGTPTAVVNRLVKEISAILDRPDVRERYLKAGLDVLNEPPQMLKKRIAREVPIYKAIIDQGGLKVP